MSPPTPQQLHARSRKYSRIDYATIGALLASNCFLLYQITVQSSLYSVFVSGLLLALSAGIHLGFTRGLFKLPKARIVEFNSNQKIGRYRAGKIYLMVRELLAPHQGKEQPKIYITFQKYDGAFVLNSLFFNFIKPLNAVYISQYLFQILKPGEIKAVLAHELAHFYGYIRPLHRVRFAIMGFNALFPIYITLNDGKISFWKALVVWFVFSLVFNRLIRIWLNRTSRDHEYLCDLAAAKRYGILNMVNGLFGVAKTGEIQLQLYKALISRIRKDNTLSLQDLEKLVARCEADLPAKAVGEKDIERLVRKIMGDQEVRELRKRLSKKEQQAEEKQIQAIVDKLLLSHDFNVLDWKRFDYVIPDGRLNPSEYERLVRTLEANPGHQLFDMATDSIEHSQKASHPTIAQRIQFLEHARQLDPSLAL